MNGKCLKIAFLEDDTADGGLGMVFRSLAKELSRDNEIIYISHRKEKEEVKKYATYVNLPFHSSIGEEENGFLKSLSGVFPLIKIIRDEQPDLVISFGFYSNVRVCLAGRFFRKTKILISERGNAKRFKHFVLFAVNAIFRRADGFVFQSNAAKSVFSKHIQKKSTVIYNAVFKDIPSRKGAKRNNDIVSVGRFHPDKNFLLLIDAFAMIAERYPECDLVIYGEDEAGSTLHYGDGMKERITSHNLNTRIKLPGQFSDVLEHIVDAKMFVLPSDLEGMPNALIEAMACGLPVITTDFDPGNAGEFVVNNQNGLIVRRRDARGLAEAMEKYLNNEDFAQQLGKRAAETRIAFSKEKIFQQWRTYIHQICD